MGIIIKESFNQTVFRIAISFVSAVAATFLYVKDMELYGLFTYVLNSSALLMPFIVLGLGQSAMRFFPYEGKSLKNRINFVKFLALILFASLGAFLLFFYFFQGLLLEWSKNPSPDFEFYLKYICIGAILFSLIEVLVKYLSNYKVVAVPVAFQTLYKLSIPVAFFLIFCGLISKEWGIMLVLFVLLCSFFALLTMAYQKMRSTDISIEEQTSSYSKAEFFNYYFWAFASTAGSLIAFKIDGLMIPTLTNFELTAEYGIAMFISTVIVIPISAVVSIAHPIISSAWKEQNLKEIKGVYLKGSENLLYIGVAMILGIFIMLDIFPLAVAEWKARGIIKVLVFILAISKLFDMASGVNGVILQHSKWYRYNTLFVLILVFVNVILNYILITKYSIIGAAVATSISLIIFNVLKTYLIYNKLDMQPFNIKMIIFVFGFALLCFASFYLNEYVSPWMAIALNTALAALYLSIWLFNLSFAQETKNSLIGILKKLG